MSSGRLIGNIEIPTGCFYKYEFDRSHRTLILDRTLTVPYPCNYGYIPETLSEDGDPIDIFVVSNYPIFPNAQVSLNLVSVIHMTDNYMPDEKLICTLTDEGRVITTSDIARIRKFLMSYKDGIIFDDLNVVSAQETLNKAYNRYRYPI